MKNFPFLQSHVRNATRVFQTNSVLATSYNSFDTIFFLVNLHWMSVTDASTAQMLVASLSLTSSQALIYLRHASVHQPPPQSSADKRQYPTSCRSMWCSHKIVKFATDFAKSTLGTTRVTWPKCTVSKIPHPNSSKLGVCGILTFACVCDIDFHRVQICTPPVTQATASMWLCKKDLLQWKSAAKRSLSKRSSTM